MNRRALAAGRRHVAFPGEGIVVTKDVAVPMSDGVTLAADLYLPSDSRSDGPLPVVVEYNPYRKDDFRHPVETRWAPRLTQSGYAFVRLDCRGTGGSGGVAVDEYTPREQRDGYEAVEWLAEQEWCDGHIALVGISYSGFTALQIAALAPPHLTTVVPVAFTDLRYADDCHYCGGLLRMYFDVGFYAPLMVAFNALPPDLESAGADWADVWRRHLDENNPYLVKWLRHQRDGPYWDCGSVGDGASIKCPVFLIGGWQDGYPNPPLRLYENLRVPKRLLVGPWDHETPDRGLPGPRIDFLRDVVRWLDHWCKGASTGVLDDPSVTVFVQRFDEPDRLRPHAAGEWRAEREWPAASARTLTLDLTSDGRLSSEPPDSAAALAFEYAPWLGTQGELWSGGMPVGRSGDQRAEEAHSLVFSSAPLATALTIVGRPRARLHLSTTASVIGVVCRLTEVAPNGTSRLVSKGMLNLTRRDSLRDPAPVVPGEVLEIDVDLDTVAWSFTPGNRVRVSVSNADFPNVWPTPEPATTTVYVGLGTRSALVLPTVANAGEAVDVPEVVEADLTYQSRLTSPRATDAHRPVWEITDDCIAGKVRVDGAWLRRAWGDLVEWRTEVDKHDPAIASAHGRMVMRRFNSTQEITSRSDLVIRSTRTDFHVTVVAAVEINGLPHFQHSWVESIPRDLV